MQEHQAAPVVYRFRPTRAALLAGLAGIVAVAFGLLAPLSAQAGDHSGNGKGNDKPWICHPVEGHGESGNGWNVINPDEHSSHIDEKSNSGKHDRKDGRTDKYKSGGKDCEYPKPTHHPKPTYTHHPKPTYTHHPKPTHHPRPTTSTETTTVTTTVTTPATPATVTSTTTPPEAPATETTPPEPPAEVPATEPPAEAPVAAPVVEAPQQAAVVENVVPQAATDGADLQPSHQGWTSLQSTLVAAGVLLLLAAGLLSARRSQKE